MIEFEISSSSWAKSQPAFLSMSLEWPNISTHSVVRLAVHRFRTI